MENLQSDQLDQSTLTNLLGGSGGSLIPESLVTTITVGIIVLNILGVLFLVFYVVGLIRKWKVQSAVLHMQKDLADIKAKLEPAAQSAETQPPHSETGASTIASKSDESSVS